MVSARWGRVRGLATALGVVLSAGSFGVGKAADRNGDYAIVGYGSYPCSSLHQDTDAGVGNWLAGYLTAINQVYDDTYDLKGDLDLDGVLDWIYTYCSTHRNDGIAQAASAFFSAHTASRRSAP